MKRYRALRNAAPGGSFGPKAGITHCLTLPDQGRFLSRGMLHN